MSLQQPVLLKAEQIVGKTLVFRDAVVADAAFILSLRLDERKSRFLNKVSPAIESQRTWLEQYESSKDQAYFVIDYEGQAIGTVRLYAPQAESFCWGSWILADTRPQHAAMESALMVYAYATAHLHFTGAHFEVRKGNERVWRFHERFGAFRISETDEDYLYRIDLQAIHAALLRYKKFLPNGVIVNFKEN